MEIATYVISGICIAVMTVMLFHVVGRTATLTGRDRYAYVKNFKKGRCFPIFFVAIPLYFIAHLYGGDSWWPSLLASFKSVIDMVVLKVEYSVFAALAAENVLFEIAVDMCIVLVMLNAAFFGVSVFGQRIVNYFRKRAYIKSESAIAVIGRNSHSKQIVKSCLGKEGEPSKVVAVFGDYKGDEAYEYFCIGVPYFTVKEDVNFAEKLDKLFNKRSIFSSGEKVNAFTEKLVNVIINNERANVALNSAESGKDAVTKKVCDDVKNLIQVKQFADYVNENKLNDATTDSVGLKVFSFGESENESTYLYFTEQTNGVITYVNKYVLGAIDFTGKYPLTQYMTDRHLNYDKATLNNDVDVSFLMIGFGKSNRQLFLTSVANNQFIRTDSNGKASIAPVSYHAFDRKNSDNEKNLNHNYRRFLMEKPEGETLPMPDEPCTISTHVIDINDVAFYNEIRCIVCKKITTYSYIAVSFGTDLENLDMAEKLAAKIREWTSDDKDVSRFVKIFVRIRNPELSKSVSATRADFEVFGNEAEVAYNANKIVCESITITAKQRNCLYQIDYDVKHPAGENGATYALIKKDATKAEKTQAVENSIACGKKDWYRRTQYERMSNVYVVLSMRFKLQLMGFDVADASDGRPAVGQDEYYEKYAKDFPMDFDTIKADFNGKKVIFYGIDTFDGKENTLRMNLAVQEHLRWNSYMLSNGIIPASIAQILTEKNEKGRFTNGKNYGLRHHGNITTFDGLVKFRQMVAERDGTSEQETDVIGYDFQIMDDVIWFLNLSGQKIVKKENE